MIDMEQVEVLIEIAGVYDGWSVAKMKDGSLVNRWDKELEHCRWDKTQQWLDENELILSSSWRD